MEHYGLAKDVSIKKFPRDVARRQTSSRERRNFIYYFTIYADYPLNSDIAEQNQRRFWSFLPEAVTCFVGDEITKF